MGIRYVAAVSVVLVHLEWLPFVATVPLFFVLSGFILTYKYVNADSGLTVDVRRFWLARLSRLYPCHLLALFLLLALRLAWDIPLRGTWGSFVASSLVLSGWLPRYAVSWNIAAWTNTCEIFFYLAFPLLVPLVLKVRTRRGMLAATTVAWLIGLAMTRGFDHARGLEPAFVDWDRWFVKFNPIIHLPEFVIGIVLGRWYSAWGCRSNRRLGDVLSGTCLVIATMLSMHQGPWFIYVHNTLLAPLFAVLIWGLLMGGAVADILGSRLLVRLGCASYAVYILQEPLLLLAHLVSGWDGFVDQPAFAVLFIFALTVVGLAVHRFVEAPVMRFLRGHEGGVVPLRALSMQIAWRESLAALALMALAIGWVSLLPQHLPVISSSRLEGTLSSIGAARVGWVNGGDERYLERYDDRLRGVRFEGCSTTCDADFVLAPRGWRDTGHPRFVEAEENDRVVLWGRSGVWLPPRYRITPRTVLGLHPHPSVRMTGFNALETAPDGHDFRWTSGEAVLEVPPPDGSEAHHLEVRLPGGVERPLEVSVDGSIVWSGNTPPSGRTLLMRYFTEASGRSQRITLRTKPWIPRDIDPHSTDGRVLGVPFWGVRILP